MIKDNQFKQVEMRLRIWGDWRIEFFEMAGGWPRQAAFLNPAPSKDSGYYSKALLHDNPLALEVDEIMNLLLQAHLYWYAAVNSEYTDKDERSLRLKKLGLSRSRYKSYLDLGKAWVEAQLG